MITIWKYELETTSDQRIKMPEDAKILTVQVQNGKPCLWAIVDTERKPEVRVIEIYGTGHPVSLRQRVYIGTYQIPDLVFHVFEYTGI